MTDPFRYQDDEDTSAETERNIKNGNFLPPEMRVRVGEDKPQDKQQYNTDNESET
jgi:hypothetical protein